MSRKSFSKLAIVAAILAIPTLAWAGSRAMNAGCSLLPDCPCSH